MKLLEMSSEIWTDVLDKVGQAWWVEIQTQSPTCTYYFGPFINNKAAQLAQPGYVEDVEQEAKVININVKRCQPKQITIIEEDDCISCN
ncbi:MAG: DUF1816 domain-containing protein [Calothrix sp. C42_A2020_038]|nr:DUF1816 domain-containing protein [Calothrix sp. C42_A2020_038]